MKKMFNETEHFPNKWITLEKDTSKELKSVEEDEFFKKLHDDIHIKRNAQLLNVKHVPKRCAALEL